jgi:hypothetical protein
VKNIKKDMRIIREDKTSKVINSVMNVALSEYVDMRVSRWDVISNVVSIFFRLFAVLFNANLAREYYMKGEILYFQLTLCFIIIPALISIILSITL